MRTVNARRIASTLPSRGDARWAESVDCIPADCSRSTWRTIRWLVRAAGKSKLLILRGSRGFDDRYVDLLAAAVVKVLRRRTRILITDATWEPGSEALTRKLRLLRPLIPRGARVAIKLVDSPRVTYGVLSTAEVEQFPRTWSVSPDRVRFTAFTHTLWPMTPEQEAVSDQGYVFAGGNSVRDYGLLAAALKDTQVRVRIAANWTPSSPLGDNFEVAARSHEEFMTLLRGCAVCVVPLQQSIRSAGQQTYLNAMLLKKIVVVTDAPGVRDYIEHGVTGIIVPPNAADLRAAVQHVLRERKSPQYKAMAEQAHERVMTTFTPIAYRRRLLQHAEELLARP
jgi:glycosyltransferase involved in cell wall biosynthesis